MEKEAEEEEAAAEEEEGRGAMDVHAILNENNPFGTLFTLQ